MSTETGRPGEAEAIEAAAAAAHVVLCGADCVGEPAAHHVEVASAAVAGAYPHIARALAAEIEAETQSVNTAAGPASYTVRSIQNDCYKKAAELARSAAKEVGRISDLHEFAQRQHVATFARAEVAEKALRDVLRLVDETDDAGSVMLLRNAISCITLAAGLNTGGTE